ADRVYDSKKVLNTIVLKDIYHRLNLEKTEQGDGRGIRKIFDKNKYKKRGICEGFFGGIMN
ncbi:hypothetical protein KKP97_03485, partial [Methanothermococcus sp. SCGC AD-155-C09]|nr:hypothetical protein [Methanothermococcus sp. SCGC AD-155-C09]